MVLDKRNIKSAGMLMIIGMLVGACSVVPVIDSTDYLTITATNANQVTRGAIFQFLMGICYVGVAILLYPIIRQYDPRLAIGFLSFRVVAFGMVIAATMTLFLLLRISEAYTQSVSSDTAHLQFLGDLLKLTRDYINHVFMVLLLCMGNLMFFWFLFQFKLVPNWISLSGLLSLLPSAIASFLLLFQVVDVLTATYLFMNAPLGLVELVLGIWLVANGFKIQISRSNADIR